MDNRGLEKLDQMLMQYGNDDSILSASELDGYFAAIVSGPRQIGPELWYPAIWEQQLPQWGSEREHEQFMKLAVELMSEAAYMLEEEPEDYEAIFLADNNGQGEKLIVSQWCAGYLRGAEVAGWIGAELPQVQEAALDAIALHGTEAGIDTLNVMSDEQYDASVACLEPAAVTLYQYWCERREVPQPIRREVKAGRNDPCPCGSGSKHKHCCLR